MQPNDYSRSIKPPTISFHLRRRSASLIHEIARSTDVAFQLIAGSALSILAEASTIGALLAVLWVTAPSPALGAVALVLAVCAVPMMLARRVWTRFGQRQKLLEEQQLHVLQQSLGAVKEVKITGREAFFEGRFRAARRALAKVKQRRASLATALRVGVETVLTLSLLVVVLVVMRRGESGASSISVLALFAYTGFRVVPSANRIMLHAGYLREGRAYVQDAIRDISALGHVTPHSHGPEPPIAFREALVCEQVSFAYDTSSVAALRDISLRLSPGESLGVVGATGSGKSTLIDVILGLLRPTAGRVVVDGRDLAGHERAWQRQVGYVPQDPAMLDETVRRNIAFGIPDALIDEHRVTRACSLAQLDEVVRELPQGLDTPLGEHGTRLSGGQRQRVAIARALYADPAVLVFDEATAALDNQTEREVTRAIATLHGTRTLIVIAHRLSTVRSCDRLIFLRDGTIQATGTYEDLLRDPAFKTMAEP